MIGRFFGKSAVRLIYPPRQTFSFFGGPGFDPTKDYYNILGVSKKATDKQIKEAYYNLAKKYHPDSQKGFENKFKEINEANSILGDEKMRRQYDKSRVIESFKDDWRNPRGGRAERAKEQQAHQQYFRQTHQYSRNWKYAWNNLNPLQKQQVSKYFLIFLLRIGLVSFSFVVLLFALFRRPAPTFGIMPDGSLSPIYNFLGQQQNPPMVNAYGNPIQGQPMQTQHFNPYHQIPPNNQYHPYNEFHTQNPNQHPYSRP